MLRGTEYLGEHLRLRPPLALTLTVFGIIVRLNTYSFKSFKEAVCLETTRMSSDIKGPAGQQPSSAVSAAAQTLSDSYRRRVRLELGISSAAYTVLTYIILGVTFPPRLKTCGLYIGATKKKKMSSWRELWRSVSCGA